MSFQSQGRDIEDLKKKLVKVTNENQSLRSELDQTRKRLKDQEEDSLRLWADIDELEQYSRKTSLEFHGIPESAYSWTEAAVLKVAEALNIALSPTDIDISHKLRRKGKTFIIARFVSHKTKTKLYKERIKLKNLHVTDIFPGYSNAAAADSSKIFINENLTAYRRSLVVKVAKMRVDGTIHSFWTIDGKVFVKTSPDGSPTKINDEADFNYL